MDTLTPIKHVIDSTIEEQNVILRRLPTIFLAHLICSPLQCNKSQIFNNGNIEIMEADQATVPVRCGSRRITELRDLQTT